MNWNKPARSTPQNPLRAEDIQLNRTDSYQPMTPTAAIQTAWEHIKSRPSETVGYGLFIGGVYFATYMFIQVVMYVSVFAAAMGSALLSGGTGSEAGIFNNPLFDVVLTVGIGVLSVSVGFAVGFLELMLIAMYKLCWLRVVRGQPAKVADLKTVFRFWKPILGAGFLSGLAMAGGMLALVIPFFIVAMGLSMVAPMVFDKGLNSVEALKGSWKLMRENKLDFFVLSLLLGLINLGGILACGLGVIITLPLSYGAVLTYYDALAEPGNAYLGASQAPSPAFA